MNELVRDHNDGLNLAIGEPFFLRETIYGTGLPRSIRDPLKDSYPLLGGEKDLLGLLQKRHPDAHVVVTGGATQAISAALWAISSTTETWALKSLSAGMRLLTQPDLCHATPYWPRYPTMARMAGMEFHSVPRGETHPLRKWSVNIVTCPNNPDGSTFYDPAAEYDIWDAAYAHPVYGWEPARTPRHRISVWSASKLLGLSGARVGWLVTKDPVLAQAAAMFVENTTSGVSVPAQRLVADAMWWLGLQGPEALMGRYWAARQTLIRNGAEFLEYLAAHCEAIHGVPSSGKGMFAWFKVREPERFARALEKSKVRLVSGAACGFKQTDVPQWYRASMGLPATEIVAPLKALSRALNE